MELPRPCPAAGRTASALKVLFVEDCASDAELEAEVIGEAGYAVDAVRVETAPDFIHALDQFQPDVILVDNRLPAFSGAEAISLARARRPQAPVVVVTGSLDDAQAAQLIELGACDYLLKERLSRLGVAVRSAVDTAALKVAQQCTAQDLHQTREQLAAVFRASPLAVIVCDVNSRIVLWNPEAERMTGWTAQEVIGRNALDFPFPDPELARSLLRRALSAEVVRDVEVPFCRKDGRVIDCNVAFAPVRDARGQLALMVSLVSDVTAAKQTALGLARADRALRTLGACNQALVHASDETGLLQTMCRIIVEVGGYHQAWVGCATDDAAARIVARASCRAQTSDEECGPVYWGDDVYSDGPAGMAVRTGRRQLILDARNDPGYAAWRLHALRHGYQSVLALPLKCDGCCAGALCIYSREAQGFSDNEISFLSEMADDMAYGMATLRERVARERDARRLRDGMVATIQAMATTLEMRDAYTAGHQRRVAALSRVLAVKLGHSEDFVYGLFLAALVHDLGKICVPAEILSKPSRLTPVELALVQTHSEAGYAILKDIDFAWPIAEIVYQHHERLDGSGYPRGLRGDAILPQARILAVADTVEAVAMHRPYRPALGLDAALQVIVGERGRLFDASVVDACIDLFRTDGYRLEG